MTTLTQIINQLNQSKLGLYFNFDCNEPENILYIVRASEAIFDCELDNQINHLARYNCGSDGDFQGWVCKDAVKKIQLLICALKRYWVIKQKQINAIDIV